VYEVAYKQAEKDFFEVHKQMNALENQAMKFLTRGENTVDIGIVNAMIPKYKEKLEAAQRRMEEAKAKIEKEKDAAQNVTKEVADLLSWAKTFDKANAETKYMLIARLVERVKVCTGYKVFIKFKISLKQFLGQE